MTQPTLKVIVSFFIVKIIIELNNILEMESGPIQMELYLEKETWSLLPLEN